MSEKDERSGFELLFISHAELGESPTDEIYEVRRVWDKDESIWYYSVIDFVRLLTRTKDATTYWATLKKRHERDEAFQAILEKMKLLRLRARDGKLRETECATRETMLRVVQEIPSPFAERVRLWLARVGEERLQEIERQTQEDELRDYYLGKGRTEEWIEARIRNLVTRNALTDEWLLRGAVQHLHFGVLTTTIHDGTFGVSTQQHHFTIKRLPKSVKKPRDHYTEEELGVLTLAELAARRLHQQHDSQGVEELLGDARVAGEFGKQVREAFEETIGGPVVSSQNFLDQPRGRKKKELPPGPQQDSLFDQGEREP
jgi:DNA-damage-inducible protein D